MYETFAWAAIIVDTIHIGGDQAHLSQVRIGCAVHEAKLKATISALSSALNIPVTALFETFDE